MRVSLWVCEARNGKRGFVKPNKKKLYPDGTVFCLRFAANRKRVNGLNEEGVAVYPV
jgi:hypothetical protein